MDDLPQELEEHDCGGGAGYAKPGRGRGGHEHGDAGSAHRVGHVSHARCRRERAVECIDEGGGVAIVMEAVAEGEEGAALGRLNELILLEGDGLAAPCFERLSKRSGDHFGEGAGGLHAG